MKNEMPFEILTAEPEMINPAILLADTLMRRARERAEGRGDNCSLVLLRLLAPPPATRPGRQA